MAQLHAEFALAKALLCIRVGADDICIGIASYPFPMDIVRRYGAVFDPMDIAAPVTFDMTGDDLLPEPALLTPDQACFTGRFRTDFNEQLKRRRAFVKLSWIARHEAAPLGGGEKARAFAERAAETLYAVSAMIGEAAMAMATDAAIAADAKAEDALPRVKGDFDAPLPERYSTILQQHFGSVWRATAADEGGVSIDAVLKDLVEGRTDAAVVGALAAARAVSAAARALERRCAKQ